MGLLRWPAGLLLCWLAMGSPGQASAADAGNPAAYAALAHGDFATARKIWTELAKNGDAEAQYNMGVMHAKGDGMGQDLAAAVRWFQLAAQQGNAKAQYNLGVMHANGDGVAADDGEALKWLRLSAKQGLAKARYSLGLMYAEGHGVARNLSVAEKWYRLAAKQGDADANRAMEALRVRGGESPVQEGEKRSEAMHPAVSAAAHRDKPAVRPAEAKKAAPKPKPAAKNPRKAHKR